MVYASSGQMKCFEGGDVGHKRLARPHKQQGVNSAVAVAGSSARTGPAAGAISAARVSLPGSWLAGIQPGRWRRFLLLGML